MVMAQAGAATAGSKSSLEFWLSVALQDAAVVVAYAVGMAVVGIVCVLANLWPVDEAYDAATALLIWGFVGALLGFLIGHLIEFSRRLRRYVAASLEERQQLEQEFKQEAVPTHPGIVLALTVVVAPEALHLLRNCSWDGTAMLAIGAALMLLLGYGIVVGLVAWLGKPGEELPEQTQLGDAHWATLGEVRTRTGLLGDD